VFTFGSVIAVANTDLRTPNPERRTLNAERRTPNPEPNLNTN
jgi:hypothetical protein